MQLPVIALWLIKMFSYYLTRIFHMVNKGSRKREKRGKMRKTLMVLLLFAMINIISAKVKMISDTYPLTYGNMQIHFFIIILLIILMLVIIFWNKSLSRSVRKRTAELEQDISRRNEIEQKMKKSEEKFRLVFENAPIGIAMVTVSGKLMDVNQAYADILGYNLDELLAGEFYNVAYPDDVEKSEAEYDKLLAGAGSGKIDKRLVKKDGSIIYVTQRLVMIRDCNDQPLFVLGMTVDVTERIKAVQKLEENDEFYRSVLNNMSGIVYNCANDVNWTVTYISEGIENISGYPASDFINNRVRSFASLIHPEDREDVNMAVQEGIQLKQPYTMEYRLIHRNGSIVWVFEEGRGIFDERGKFLHLNGTIINITERKNSEMELQNYHQHLEEMVEARTQELAEKNNRLEDFNRLFVGREFRIKELRDEVGKLKQELEKHGIRF